MNDDELHIDKLLTAVRKLGIPTSEFCVVGSMAFRFNGLIKRRPGDLDNIVKPKRWDQITLHPEYAAGKSNGPRPGTHWHLPDGLYIDIKPSMSLTPHLASSLISDPFRNASCKNGVLVADPFDDIAFKIMKGRAKDADDVEKVRKCLQPLQPIVVMS
jgi:hypothetical protein